MIRISTVFLLFLSSFLLVSCEARESKEVDTIHKLAANAKKTIQFKSQRTTKVTFTTKLSDDERKNCINQCIKMYHIDNDGKGTSIKSATSGSLEIEPIDGKVNFTIVNQESFPISTIISWK